MRLVAGLTWGKGAPANRATRLEGLRHSPPLHATHPTGTVSGLRELCFERLLSTTSITATKETFSHLISLHSWRDCKRTRNKVLAAEPTIKRAAKPRGEWGEGEAPPPTLFRAFALAIPPATQATILFQLRIPARVRACSLSGTRLLH